MAHPNFRNLAINYGLTLGGISVILTVIQYALGDFNPGQQGGSPVYTFLGFVVGVAVVVMALSKLKKLQGGYMQFGEGFKLGFSVYIYSSLVISVWFLVYGLVLEPGYQEAALAATADQIYESSPDISDDQMEVALSWTEKMTSPWALVVFTILMSALMGAIISAITAAFMKKNKPEGFPEEVA